MLGNKFLWKMWHNHCRTNRRVCRHMSALIYWETMRPFLRQHPFRDNEQQCLHVRAKFIIEHAILFIILLLLLIWPLRPSETTPPSPISLEDPPPIERHRTFSSYKGARFHSHLPAAFPRSFLFFVRCRLERSGVLLGSFHQRSKCHWSVNAHVHNKPFVPHSFP